MIISLAKDLQSISGKVLCFLDQKFNEFSSQDGFCNFHDLKYIWFDNSNINVHEIFQMRYNKNRRKIPTEILKFMKVYNDEQKDDFCEEDDENELWKCFNCTFVNNWENSFCQMCGNLTNNITQPQINDEKFDE